MAKDKQEEEHLKEKDILLLMLNKLEIKAL